MADDDVKKMAERYMEQMLKLATETGRMVDGAIGAMEKNSKDVLSAMAKEARPHTEAMKAVAAEMATDVRQDLPRIRQELLDLERRARERLKDLDKL